MEHRKCFINNVGQYYEGDRIDAQDEEVIKRPDYLHDWIGGQWVKNLDREKLAINAPITEQLEALDIKTIRALREGNASRLATLEAQAVEIRAKLAK